MELSKFEQDLWKDGWEMWVDDYDWDKKERYPACLKKFEGDYTKVYITSMASKHLKYGVFRRTWRKGDRCIDWGLSESDKPPTITYPRPYIKEISTNLPRREVKEVNGNKILVEWKSGDDGMNKVLMKYTTKEILEAMFDKTKILEVE